MNGRNTDILRRFTKFKRKQKIIDYDLADDFFCYLFFK